jgi:hypothetical protein
MSVNAGGYGGVSAQSRLRAAVNARLEEISFRAGVTAAMVALLVLAAIATAGVFAATLSLGGTAVAAQGAQSAIVAPQTAPAAPTVAPATTAAEPTTHGHPRPTVTPRASQPVTAATTTPQSTAGSQPWTQSAGSQSSSPYSGQAGFGHHDSWSESHGSRYGSGSWHGGSGYPGQGFGFPGQGFGFPGQGFGFRGPGGQGRR